MIETVRRPIYKQANKKALKASKRAQNQLRIREPGDDQVDKKKVEEEQIQDQDQDQVDEKGKQVDRARDLADSEGKDAV